jgi:hypothetical protein
MQSTLEDFHHTAHIIPGRKRARSPERSMVQVRIHDMKKVVNIDKVIEVKEKLLALIGRDPTDDNLTERVVYFLERLKSFSISLEVLEETSVGKCVYRFRNDSSEKVAILAEEIYQLMKAKAQEGTERRLRHKSLGIDDASAPTTKANKATKPHIGAFTSAPSVSALAVAAAATAATAASSSTGGIDWILQHGGSQQRDVDADIEEWEKASSSSSFSSRVVAETHVTTVGSTIDKAFKKSTNSLSVVLPRQGGLQNPSSVYIPPPPPPPPIKSALTFIGLNQKTQLGLNQKTQPSPSRKPSLIEEKKVVSNAFEKLLRKR